MPDAYDHIEITERERALVELVNVDHDATLKTISGVLATGAAIRAAGFAGWCRRPRGRALYDRCARDAPPRHLPDDAQI